METLQTVSTMERILLLREVPIFANLSPEDLGQIAEIAHEQWFPDKTVICRAGEQGNTMYIIVSGDVQVVKESDAGEKVLALRGAGEFVGEMAIIESAPRIATLRAQGDVRMLVIDGDIFKAILHDRPEVSEAVLKSMSRRLREITLSAPG
jgi:CRP-like cAMP-binding protein